MMSEVLRALGVRYPAGSVPPVVTFPQFVGYLVGHPREVVVGNNHWRPQWLQCEVCTRSYNMSGQSNSGQVTQETCF